MARRGSGISSITRYRYSSVGLGTSLSSFFQFPFDGATQILLDRFGRGTRGPYKYAPSALASVLHALELYWLLVPTSVASPFPRH